MRKPKLLDLFCGGGGASFGVATEKIRFEFFYC